MREPFFGTRHRLVIGWLAAGFVVMAGASGTSATAEQTLLEVLPVESALWSSDFDPNPIHPDFPSQFADTFTLTDDAVITGLDWWGGYFRLDDPDVLPTNFIVRFFAVDGGVPQAQTLFEFSPASVDVSVFEPGTFHSIAIYGYSASAPSVTLPAGDYGLSIMNDTSGDAGWWDIRLAVDLSGGAFARVSDGDEWRPVLGELAIRLRGVPEPTSAAVLFAGVGFIFARRRAG